jgi:uncharacterized membrane protein YvbJ
MFCTKCGKNIDDNLMYCPACGSPTSLQAQQPVQNQYNQPIIQQPYQNQQNQYAGMPGFAGNYPAVSDFADQAKSLRNLGIAAAILMFGIGFIFSIIIFVKSKKLKVPELFNPTPDEMKILEDGKKKLKTAKILAILPFIAFGISFIYGFINGFASAL